MLSSIFLSTYPDNVPLLSKMESGTLMTSKGQREIMEKQHYSCSDKKVIGWMACYFFFIVASAVGAGYACWEQNGRASLWNAALGAFAGGFISGFLGFIATACRSNCEDASTEVK